MCYRAFIPVLLTLLFSLYPSTVSAKSGQTFSEMVLLHGDEAKADTMAVILECTGLPASCDQMDCLKGRPLSCSEFCEYHNQNEPTYSGSKCEDDGEGRYDCVCCYSDDGVNGNPPCAEPSIPSDLDGPIGPSAS